MRRFHHRAPVALLASALDEQFASVEPAEPFDVLAGVAVVSICGPLTQHQEHDKDNPDEVPFDSYDAIKSRVAAALGSSAPAVVLRINSPGGAAAGCNELSRDLRSMAARAGKKLYAYADGMAASAAYALACAAESIHLPPTGLVGSIGVLHALVDLTEADRRAGLRFEFVSSGARKTDGNAHVAISDSAIAEAQGQVDYLANLFFGLVAESRGMSVDSVRALEAGVMHGQRAVDAGIADSVCTFEGLLALAGGSGAASVAAQKGNPMDMKEMIAALKAAAEGDGEDADKAKKMLAALEGDDEDKPKDEEKPKDEAKSESEGDEAKSEGSEEKPKDEDKPAAKATVSASSPASVLARLEAVETREERSRLLASRPDLTRDPKTNAWLSSAPIDEVRRAIAAITAPKAPKLAAAVVPASTQPNAHGRGGNYITPNAELDVQMGLARATTAIRHEGNKLLLGVMTPAEAKAELARRTDSTTKKGAA